MKKFDEKNIVLKDPVSGYDKRIKMKTFKHPNGMVENFFIDDDSDSVQVFAIIEGNEEVVVVKQFRPGSEEQEVELPGGGMEPGEDPLISAKRELLEETGYSSDELELLSVVPYSPYSTGKRYNVLARNCKKTSNELDLDPNEFLSMGTIELEKFKGYIRKGKIRGADCAYQGLDVMGIL